MDKTIEILKALSDPTRLRILMSMSDGELCVCQIVSLIKLAPSTISKHISILKHAGLIVSRKDGRWIYYQHNKKSADTINCQIIEMLNSDLAADEIINGDRAELTKILSENEGNLCAKISCGKN